MLELTNTTPFVADFALLPNDRGIQTLYLLVKATFIQQSRLTIAPEQQPLCKGDVYLAEPVNSSLVAANEYHTGKVATDVIVQGNAVTANGQAQTQLEVQVVCGHLHKVVTVLGDRNWQAGGLTRPQPFYEMPLVYERAFGGDGATLAQSEHAPVDYNPAGVGYYPGAQADATLPAPNIELPGQPMQTRHDRPPPAGLDFIAGHWAPRRAYGGTYDERWQTERAPFYPEDFSPKFFNCASPGLSAAGFFNGNEPFAITGMHAEGTWQGHLPALTLQADVRIGRADYALPFALETVLLQPNRRTLVLQWRAQLALGHRALQIERMNLRIRAAEQAL